MTKSETQPQQQEGPERIWAGWPQMIYSTEPMQGLVEYVRADLPRATAEAEWQPIETAPKDGTEVLLVWHWDSGLHQGVSVVTGRWMCSRHCHSARPYDCPNEPDCDMGWSRYARTMSHWQPMPPLPRAWSKSRAQKEVEDDEHHESID